MRGRCNILWAFILCSTTVVGQISPIDQALEYLAEFGQTENQEADLVQLAEQLSYLQNNPISLNTATPDELLEIPLLNSFLVFNLISYRNTAGRFLSYYQLADLDGFTKQIIYLIQPFTTLEYRKQSNQFPKLFAHQLALQYKRIAQKSEGYKNQNYLGDANALYLRYRIQAEGKLFAGITLQKDAGEMYLTNNMPDFTSIHFEYRFNNIIKNIVLGDYSVEFGQGLVLWSSLAFNKSSEAVTVQRFGRGIRYYSGADENRFLRGAGTTIAIKNLELTTFYSTNKIDANLDVNASNAQIATSLQSSGFHRTANELEDKRSQQIMMTGVHLQWKPKRLRLGFLANKTSFKYPIFFQDRIENVNKFSGNKLLHTSADWKWLYGHIYFFGEFGYEWQMGASALTTGMQVKAADGFQFTVHYRHFSPNWYAPYSQPFSETGREGEQGAYFGINWQLPHRLSVGAYADFFKYLWQRTELTRPGLGKDFMVQLNYAPELWSTYFRVRFQGRERKIASNQTIATNNFLERLGLRWHATFSVTDILALQSRIEWATVQHQSAPQNGLLAFLGASFKLHNKWQLKMRYTLFDTENYATAIWAYEDDVPYSYSVPAYYNNGTKWYAMVTWQARKNMELWFRIADLNYNNQTTIGSGYDLINSAHRTEIKALLRITF